MPSKALSEREYRILAGWLEIRRDSTRNNTVHHQTMAEGDGTRAQHLFAQDRALRVHHRERGVVADRTDVAQVIRDPLKLRHHRAHPYRARWRVELECRLHGESEDERIRHRTVPGRSRRNSPGGVHWLAAQQLLDAFVPRTKALFQPDALLA